VLDRIPWNLTRKLERFRAADVIVLSLGKSGRTWLRVMLHQAIAHAYGVPFDPIRLEPGASGAPRIAYSHELATHLRQASLPSQLIGKSILPRSVTDGRRLIVLARDPRDVVVSSWYHKTERSQKTELPLADFVRHPRWGIEGLVTVLNRWRVRFRDHPRCHWLAYEGLQRDAAGELARLFAFHGLAVGEGAIRSAVDAARFDRMKAAEAAGTHADMRLRPGDPARPDSFKVRRGRVGGYRDEFDAESLVLADAAVARLDPFFGYGPTPAGAPRATAERRGSTSAASASA